MRVLAVLLAAMSLASAPVQADYMADYDAAIRDGFTPVEWAMTRDTLHQWLDREVVSHWMAFNDTESGTGYLFDYVTADINGDGFGDAVIMLQLADHLVPDGSPVLLVLKDGRGWRVAEASYGVDVAIRKTAQGADVAYLNAAGEGYRLASY